MATILVVDDHPMNREFLVTLLGYQKHNVLEAADGLQALEIIQKESVDLIISDILMPNLDGYELVQKIKADKALMNIPIIFYSATYSAREANVLAKSCGAAIVITKPAEPQEILKQVGTILKMSSSDQTIELEVSEKKESSRMNLSDNLSLFFEELNTTHQYLNKRTAVANTPEHQETYDELALKIKKLQENDLRISALIKLGFNLITERDLLRMFKLFGRTACSIMKAQCVTIGLIDDHTRLSGSFCITTMSEKIDAYYSSTCTLTETILRSLFMGQSALRISELSQTQLPDYAFSNRSFLGTPILSSTKKYGVIYFLGKRGAQEFTEEDERIIATMAAALAVLYENIRLYDTVQQHTTKLQLEIAERKNIENELHHSEERLKLSLDAAHMHAWEWNLQTGELKEFGHVELMSCGDFHHDGKDFLEKFANNIHSDDREKVMQSIGDAVRLNLEYEVEFRLSEKYAAVKWIAIRGQVFPDENGMPRYMIGVGIDISERKKAEQLAHKHQAESAYIARVNSMGEMASALAHELNQPLTAINSYVSGCIHRLEKNTYEKDQIIDVLKKTMQNAELAGQIIHRMKNFIRNGELHYENISINYLVKEVALLFQCEIQDAVFTITFELAENLPEIVADKIQIEQVLLNLFRNGFEAMIEAGSQVSFVVRTEYLATTHTIAVSVEDSGPGISMDNAAHLFTPYFTTKVFGMGMGLAICRTIIEAHGGQISTKITSGVGSCFQFTLPVTRNEYSNHVR